MKSQVFRKKSALTFIILLGCWIVHSVPPTGHSASYFMVFSGGTRLLVNAGEETADYNKDDEALHCQNKTTGSVGPTVQILSMLPLHQDPGSVHLLVCLLSGLNSPVQDILWWVNDTESSTHTAVSMMVSDGGRAYSAFSVLEVSAADWSFSSTYWCGTVQRGRVYRQRLCSQDESGL